MSPTATPAMVLLGLIVSSAAVPELTRDFLTLKRTHFPGRFESGLALDHILGEIKGSEILQMTRSRSRNQRRKADRFRSDLLDIVEAHKCRVVGRVWIKQAGRGLNPTASYGYAVQDIVRHFCHFLTSSGDMGVLIADGREHHTNLGVSHSIFTQKWRTGGDPYTPLGEVPLFAASENHAGLQIADLLASTLAFPMAAAAYCPRRPGNPHSSGLYANVQANFGTRLRELQYRYRDEIGRWRGGLVVSDPVTKGPGSRLFGAGARLSDAGSPK